MQRQPRKRSEARLDEVRDQPCIICGDPTTVEAHHPRVGVVGMARKADDDKAVPLCGRHHRELHRMNEAEFWASYGFEVPS